MKKRTIALFFIISVTLTGCSISEEVMEDLRKSEAITSFEESINDITTTFNYLKKSIEMIDEMEQSGVTEEEIDEKLENQ